MGVKALQDVSIVKQLNPEDVRGASRRIVGFIDAVSELRGPADEPYDHDVYSAVIYRRGEFQRALTWCSHRHRQITGAETCLRHLMQARTLERMGFK